jgi:hypothetical protein
MALLKRYATMSVDGLLKLTIALIKLQKAYSLDLAGFTPNNLTE